jgi:predicted nucleic acid-binding protein
MVSPNVVFLDTSGLIALLNKDDDLHVKTAALVEELDQAGRSLVTTDWILAETGNGLARTAARSLFVAAARSFASSPRCRIVRVDQILYEKALDRYAAVQDKSWGLIDCASFVVMNDHGIHDALTADHHFRQAGFTCLLSFS